jgi:hypothetical protein
MLKKFVFFRFPWRITFGNKAPIENILAGTLFLKVISRRTQWNHISCNHSDTARAYDEAPASLEEEFGNGQKTAIAFLQKLRDWLIIKSKDNEGLENLSVYLMTCSNSMGSTDILNQLNDPQEIMGVVMKLPFELRKSWRNKTLQLVDNDAIVRFRDLVSFVRLKARLLNQPLFGTIKIVTRIEEALHSKKKYISDKQKTI